MDSVWWASAVGATCSTAYSLITLALSIDTAAESERCWAGACAGALCAACAAGAMAAGCLLSCRMQTILLLLLLLLQPVDFAPCWLLPVDDSLYGTVGGRAGSSDADKAFNVGLLCLGVWAWVQVVETLLRSWCMLVEEGRLCMSQAASGSWTPFHPAQRCPSPALAADLQCTGIHCLRIQLLIHLGAPLAGGLGTQGLGC